jgi:hypothetical protein
MRFYHNIVLRYLIAIPFYILLILACYTYCRYVTPALECGAHLPRAQVPWSVARVLFPKQSPVEWRNLME